jgi:prepilin-type N-terminal cleavage/methylation domain-containing protein
LEVWIVERKGERGFTLIELMIVVAIIAILAGILIPNFVNARALAQTSACESNLRSIATALELVYADEQTYEPNGQANFNADPADFTNAAGTVYLNNTPKDAAAQDLTQFYTVKVTPQSGGAPPSYVITCPGTHVGSTLAKLQKAGTTDGSVCGAACTSTTITYTSGTGMQAQ